MARGGKGDTAKDRSAVADPLPVQDSTPTPRCAVCAFKAPTGTLLYDFHRWPEGPRWVHRSCVAGSTRESALDRAEAHANGVPA